MHNLVKNTLPSRERLLSLRNTQYNGGWDDAQKNAYSMAHTTVYDSKTLTVPRPFPIYEIYIETHCYPNNSSVNLRFRTHLGQGLIHDALSYIPWDKKYFRDNFDSIVITYYFGLHTESIDAIKALCTGIFRQLISVADLGEVQHSLRFGHEELMGMLDVYYTDFIENFTGLNHFLNGRYHETDSPVTKTDAFAEAIHTAIYQADTGKVLTLLKQGVDPNVYFDDYTPLIATIIFGTNHALYNNGRDKEQLLPQILSIIGLLLEYGANPMGESQNHSAMEEVVLQSTYRRDCNLEFFAAILQLLTAGNGIQPHIVVTEQDKTASMGLIVSGVNCFLKQLTPNKSPKIIACFKQDHLYFITSLNTVITVKTFILDNMTKASRENLYSDKAMWELFERHFPGQAPSYFKGLLKDNTSAIDLIYMNHELLGMNIVNTRLIQSRKTFILYYIKLAVADPELRAFPRFMSIISFARGFSLQKKFPMLEVITYYEAAAASSYLQTCNLDIFPKINSLHASMDCIGKHLYPEKLRPLKNAILVEDDLGGADKPVIPGLFWDSKPGKTQKLPLEIHPGNAHTFFLTSAQLAQKGFRERYLQNKEKYSVIVGFLNNANNFKKLEKKINPHAAGIFGKAIQSYAKIGPDPVIFKQAKL